MSGEEYRARRKAARLTQEQLAERLDVSLRTIVRIEGSEVVSTVDELALTALLAGPGR